MPPRETTITVDASKLSKAADRLLKISQLVPTPDGMSNDIYATFKAKSGQASTAILSVQRFGIHAKVKVGNCSVESPLPMVTLSIPITFLRNIGHEGAVVLAQDSSNAGTLKYKRGRLTGTVSLSDPSASFETVLTGAPTDLKRVKIKPLMNGMSATLFASADPRVAATGPITRIMTPGPRSLAIVTYDSLAGAVFTSETEDDMPNIDVTIPNRVFTTLVGQTDDDYVHVGYNEAMFKVKTSDLEVVFPMADYPIIDVADRIKDITETAERGFSVTPSDLINAIESVTSLANMDKEIISTELRYSDSKLLVRINSEKLSGKNMVEVRPLYNEPFSVMCDSRRLIGFIKQTKSLSSIEVYYNADRIIVKTPLVTYAFPGS